jgi:hypothetical protein
MAERNKGRPSKGQRSNTGRRSNDVKAAAVCELRDEVLCALHASYESNEPNSSVFEIRSVPLTGERRERRGDAAHTSSTALAVCTRDVLVECSAVLLLCCFPRPLLSHATEHPTAQHAPSA